MDTCIPKTTLDALISLMDEPDEQAFGKIHERILLLGNDAIRPLESALENTFQPVVRDRIASLLHLLRQARLRDEIEDWIATGSSDLLKGFILVTRTEFPGLDEQKIVAAIEQLRVDIWVELHDSLTSLENVRVMNHVIFDIGQFGGNKNDPAAVSNNYINRLLETRLGNPLSIGMLYLILARRLGLPVWGVNLPQHFILAYLTDPGIAEPREDDVLFYINPFNRGTVFTRREIDLFVRQLKIKPEESFFTPCSNPVIIRRLIQSLIFSYKQVGDPGKTEDLESLLTLFE